MEKQELRQWVLATMTKAFDKYRCNWKQIFRSDDQIIYRSQAYAADITVIVSPIDRPQSSLGADDLAALIKVRIRLDSSEYEYSGREAISLLNLITNDIPALVAAAAVSATKELERAHALS
ncbi:MAG TPA: hypothetical protein VMD74_00515 [Candidatus Methylomirabilis sp.]|nr:hypothetical protein [Candidatus Methylomirabilis sp.]